jgi:hypothetical protein
VFLFLLQTNLFLPFLLFFGCFFLLTPKDLYLREINLHRQIYIRRDTILKKVVTCRCPRHRSTRNRFVLQDVLQGVISEIVRKGRWNLVLLAELPSMTEFFILFGELVLSYHGGSIDL